MPLTTTVKREPAKPGTVTVALSGSLDTATSAELERDLAPVLSGAEATLIFDLAELKFVTSAGIRVLVGTAKKLKARNGKALMVNQQPQIAEVFKIIKALPDVNIFASVQELDDYLATMQRKTIESGGSR
jgi:anti-anti-sigma factor